MTVLMNKKFAGDIVNGSKMDSILIIDDSAIILNVYKTFLKKENYYVKTALSALEAAQILQKQRFSLVICDINMPEINGLELLLWIINKYPEQKVVFITASTTYNTKQFLAQNGALNLYKKGDEWSLFLEMVAQSLSGGLWGKIKDIKLIDFMNFISVSKTKKNILLNDYVSNKSGLIFFEDGNVIHASYDKYEGIQAFYEIMQFEKGDFQESNEPSDKNSIKIPFEILMLNTAQIIDEKVVSPDKQLKSDNKKRILIISNNLESFDIIMPEIKNEFSDIFTGNSIINGISIIQKENIDFLLLDTKFSETNYLNFLNWVSKNSPYLKILLNFEAGNSENINKTIQEEKLYVSFFETPLNYQQIKIETERLLAENKFSANIKGVGLLDLLQVLSMSKTSKIIYVEEPITHELAVLYMENGDLVHTEFGLLKGEKAFFSIIRFKSGKFYDSEWKEPKEKTINKGLGKLILKAFKMLSENEHFIGNVTLNVYVNPDSVEEALFRDSVKNQEINEAGIFLGIELNKTNCNEVLEKFSIIKTSLSQDNTINLPEMGITIIIGSNNIVEEITFDSNFNGSTSKGLKIKDTMEKALRLYGEPRFSEQNYAVWEKISVFSDESGNINQLTLGVL
jgi:CheY-like chemotaxis protein